jgi:hypothetical protein
MNAATGDFAVVEYHVFDDTATSWGNARLNFYGSLYNGVPFFVYNGKYDAWPISNYDDALLAELDIPTDVTIHMFGVPGIGVDEYDFVAEVCIEPGGIGKTMVFQMVQVLDKFPTHHTYSRNGFRQAASEETLTIAAGACQTVNRSFTFDSTSMATPEDILVIAWAQANGTSGPADVHQAAISHWPFAAPAPPLFEDGFEDGTTDAWN